MAGHARAGDAVALEQPRAQDVHGAGEGARDLLRAAGDHEHVVNRRRIDQPAEQPVELLRTGDGTGGDVWHRAVSRRANRSRARDQVLQVGTGKGREVDGCPGGEHAGDKLGGVARRHLDTRRGSELPQAGGSGGGHAVAAADLRFSIRDLASRTAVEASAA